MLNPKGVWNEIQNETTTVKDLYLGWLIPAGGFLYLCQFLGNWLYGQSFGGITLRSTFFGSLTSNLTQFIMSLIGAYVAAFVLSFLAPKFAGQNNIDRAMRLVAYSWTPLYVSGVFKLLPGLGIVSLILGIYCIYIFWNGVVAMTGIAFDKKIPYTAVSVICIFIINLVLGVIAVAVGGTGYTSHVASDMQKIEMPGGYTFDPNEAQKSLDQLQKILPKQP